MATALLEWLRGYQFNSSLALLTYWAPLAVCLSVYTARSIQQYREDLRDSDKNWYRPTLTLGTLLGYLLLAALPVVNIFAAVFDCAASALSWLGRVLNAPLVRPRKAS